MTTSDHANDAQLTAGTKERGAARLDWLWDILLVGVLLAGALFRFTGVNWDENHHLHPDERFLTMVQTAIQPVTSLAEYFDTANSSLNPNNRGYGFFVYGTLPLFAVRYAGEWMGKTGYDQIHIVGRQMSAVMDLGTVLVVYLIGARLYGSRRLGLLASAFAALMVLPIQLSHYATVDTFTNFFGILTVYFAIRLLPQRWVRQAPQEQDLDGRVEPSWSAGLFQEWRSAIPHLLFGAALGLAMASKINAVLLAVLLPAAVLLRYLNQPVPERRRWLVIYLRNMALGALACLVVFRICQPYAFSGPGFFGFTPNPAWMDAMRSLAAQSTGDVDFPPALQWARRPIWFAFQHMVMWGLGLPLGILAWCGFLWMGYRIIKAGERQHLILWGWTGINFAYQSINFTRSMRYQMLIYPTLAVIAAWAVWALWQKSRAGRPLAWKTASLVTGLVVLSLTFAWAFAFVQIYVRPMTRVEASRWIYQNVPGPINLRIADGEELTSQPVSFKSGYTLRSAEGALVLAFRPRAAGELVSLDFEHIANQEGDGLLKTMTIAISDSSGSNSLATARLADEFRAEGDPRGKNYSVTFNDAVLLAPDQTYYFFITLEGQQSSLGLAGPITAAVFDGQNLYHQALPEPVDALRTGKSFRNMFTAQSSGKLFEVSLPHVVDWEGRPDLKTLRVAIRDAETGSQVLASAEIQGSFAAESDPRGKEYIFRFERPAELEAQRQYIVEVEQAAGPGALAVYGSKQANESSWDDALPVALDGYNAYDYNYGIYRSDLNFEMYWDDNADKLNRFLTTLDQADYIFISSNRQWGTTTRLPERYPLTIEYYRQLLGCPPEKEITWCYSVAEPGMYSGSLGFELQAVFQSDPTLGSLRFNTQFAEEAFTVYDHPKVLIFRKTDDYDPARAAEILRKVDLTAVVHVTPRKAGSYPANLLLPLSRLVEQRAGGTWAELFDPRSLINRYPGLGAVAWYLLISVLGWAAYPFSRLALGGLPDRGYPQLRLIGLILLALPVWLLGSYRAPFEPLTITLVFGALLAASLAMVYTQRDAVRSEIRENWRYFLAVEGCMLAFFLLFLLVRFANPDLWHPWKGGEKPMDFSYFNAVLKSTSFPPYDPWFAGGYINYYYYGYVLVGVPVKWLGITPAVAYNLILPTLFSLLAMAAFSIGWNLLAATRSTSSARRKLPHFEQVDLTGKTSQWYAGLFSAAAVAVLGNWGTVRMIWHGLQRLADMQVPFEQATLIQRIAWTFQGLSRLIGRPGTRLPFGYGDWYWIPSRAIPGEPITEFPAFTFLYADLHAHMIALPITLLALSWAMAVMFQRWQWKGWGHLAASFLLGGAVIGALKPTNTWDWPAYLAFGCIAIVYSAMRYGSTSPLRIPGTDHPAVRRVLFAVTGVVFLVGLSSLLYQPFSSWYGQGYNQIDPWQGARTPAWSYLTHWGVFLFLIASWMAWETVDWMASTPVSALNRLRRYREIILLGLLLLLVMLAGLLALGVGIAWLVMLLGAWAAILLLRPGQPDAKRAVLLMVGTGLALTLFVEVAVLRGDIGRMNTVFKFYLQAWSLFALSAGAGLAWLLPEIGRVERPGLRRAWSIAAVLLVSGAALFPVLAGVDKLNDRMTRTAPKTLDGMAYMAVSSFAEGDRSLELVEDYRAIRWMQENIPGSPVIVEANVPEYRWGNRFTIYTGLPSVVGWNWHQRQQRAITPGEWVFNRVEEIRAFYSTTNQKDALDFLERYQVEYVVVGQLEKAVYPPAGLAKFTEQDGISWQRVYEDGQTAIYRVGR